MPKCGYCGSTIIIGGVRAGEQRFCNNRCHQNAYVLSVSQRVPPDLIARKVEETWRGNCPKCGSNGPVDLHKYYQVWSALVLTRWTTNAQVSCRSCATKRQLVGIALSAVAGWWGFPWGLILTPVQITRNVVALCKGPDTSRPSDGLQKLVQVNLGAQIMAANQKAATKPPPVLAK